MEHTTAISFPGLNIGEFKLKNVAFTVFGHPIMWYGIIITLGIIVAYLYASYRAKKNENISSDDMLDYTIFAVMFGVIGARLYYVITQFSDYKGDSFGETLKNIIAVWNGGLAIYGGIIGGIIAIFVTSKIKKHSFPQVLDCVAPGVMLAQAIGRWGNFFNGEAFGSVTKLPWRMCGERFASYLLEKDLISTGTYKQILDGYVGVHPTFIYESLWNVLGFIIINAVYKKKKFTGQIVLMYLSWYGLGRFFIEGLRTDSLYFLKPVFNESIRISQALAALFFIFCTAALIILFIKKRKPIAVLSDGNCGSDKSSPSVTDDITDSKTDSSESDEFNTTNTEENKNESD